MDAPRRGRLRVYLGAAPGVGKTFRMLEEGHRRRDRGTDVVIGFVEPHGRARTAALIDGLEVIARKQIVHRGATLTEMDVDGVLTRRPQVALVDEMAHTNAPGSANAKRWQDIDVLLDAGIDVITTLNIQHLESLNDALTRITGIEQQETVPDGVVRRADQIELVDMSPEALRRRMIHGNVYPLERVDAALSNYFRVGNLTALRELALLWVADRVDDQLLAYRVEHGIDTGWETRERLVVAVTGAPTGEHLIRRAARMAERSRADLFGVHVRGSEGLGASGDTGRLTAHRQLLTDLGGEYHELVGDDVAEQLVAFARAENATQLVLGTTRRGRFAELFQGSVINRTIRRSPDLDVHVISFEADGAETPAVLSLAGGVRRSHRISVRRRMAAWLLATLGPMGLVAIFLPFRDDDGLPGALPALALLVAIVAFTGGPAPAMLAAGIGFTLGNAALTRPYGRLHIDELSSVIGLTSFLAVGIVASVMVGRLGRRTTEASRARAQAEALAASAATLAGDDPVPELLDRARLLLGLDGLAIESPEGERIATVGDPAGITGRDRITLADGSTMLTSEEVPDAENRLVLRAFGDQLAAAHRRAELSSSAARAAALAEVDRFRTALLRAVSHDLRSPLASIKAAASSLLQDDVVWPPEAEHEFLATIVEEGDRLDRIIANLLDASRLDAGVLSVSLAPVAVVDLVERVVATAGGDRRICVDVDPAVPPVLADRGLLERVVENVLGNAVTHSPQGQPIEVTALASIDESTGLAHVSLLVIDHGPGVPEDHRAVMFEAFGRLGDDTPGVGLGLSVARSFVEAMGGELIPSTTPGGGLTMDVRLPGARVGSPEAAERGD